MILQLTFLEPTSISNLSKYRPDPGREDAGYPLTLRRVTRPFVAGLLAKTRNQPDQSQPSDPPVLQNVPPIKCLQPNIYIQQADIRMAAKTNGKSGIQYFLRMLLQVILEKYPFVNGMIIGVDMITSLKIVPITYLQLSKE
jgi:hypothetical protein